MAKRVYSFSIPPTDTAALKLLKTIKDTCKQTGVSFSHVILKALEAQHGK